LIDTKALAYALDKNILAGAALDVLEGEEDIKEERQLIKGEMKREEMEIFVRNHILLKDKDVLITPHSAFYTKEALERILDTTISNVKGFSKKRVVNKVA